MARTNYSFGKRQRELEKEKKKKDKEARKRDRAASGGDSIPIATVEELQGGGNMMSIDEVMRSMQGEGSESSPQARTIPSRLFVGGLAWGITSDQLRQTFEAVGRVADAVVMVDRDTGDSRGFGFVTMADRKDASEAIRRLDGSDLEGRTLVVRQATERTR
jgi:RNA recognition motif-containing protein